MQGWRGSFVLGEALLTVALGDLYADTVGCVPFQTLKADKLMEGQALVGSVTTESLAEQLVSTYNFGFPHTFNRVKAIVTEAGHNVVECLILGFQEIKLRYFPVLRLTDPNKHYVVRKVVNKFLAAVPKEAELASLVGEACVEIERQGLTYARNLERYQVYGMPWLEPILLRLPKMGASDRLTQLAFLSCVGLCMNGEFVEYNRLKLLAQEMVLPQSELQKRLIQGRDLMENFTVFRLWKLHKSIPYRPSNQLPSAPKLPPKEVAEPVHEPEEIQVLGRWNRMWQANAPSAGYFLSL